jgi:hypothetical protein
MVLRVRHWITPCVEHPASPIFSVTKIVAPNGDLGNVDLPMTPGYVIPNCDRLFTNSIGVVGTLCENGYLVPAADAPEAK